MNSDFELAKNILNTQGKLIGQTGGNSMYPLFRDKRDKAVIVPLPEKLKVNDVLLYRKAETNEVILHRVVKITKNGPILRGDNLFRNETNISKDDILGVMQGFHRNGKYYQCNKSFMYTLYIIILRLSYPIRYLIKKTISLIRKIKNGLSK